MSKAEMNVLRNCKSSCKLLSSPTSYRSKMSTKASADFTSQHFRDLYKRQRTAALTEKTMFYRTVHRKPKCKKESQPDLLVDTCREFEKKYLDYKICKGNPNILSRFNFLILF